MKLLVFLTLFLSIPFFAIGAGIKVQGSLYVVHASHTYDPLALAKPGIEEIIELWDKAGLPVIHLRHNDSLIFEKDGPQGFESYYINVKPHHTVINSEGGEHQSAEGGSDVVTFVGLYLEACVRNAMSEVLKDWEQRLYKKKEPPIFQVYLPATVTNTSYADIDNLNKKRDRQLKYDGPVVPGFTNLHLITQVPSSCKINWLNFIGNEMYSFGSGDVLFGLSLYGKSNFQLAGNHNLEIRCNQKTLQGHFRNKKPTIRLHLFSDLN